jgi:hypothetical protein
MLVLRWAGLSDNPAGGGAIICLQELQAYVSQKIHLRFWRHRGAGLSSHKGDITMQLTTEENERTAYSAGNTALATAWGRIIDLEQERLLLRQCIRNVLWAARELDAGRALTVEGAAYLSDAAELLDSDA